jgi:lipoyl-dependent peroxiredoxin
MAIRQAEGEWQGNLKDGKGTVKLGSGAFHGAYSFQSRFEEGTGTNPEELIAAAHAGCYSMALSHGLAQGGFTPTRVHTIAKVHLEKTAAGFAITAIDLETDAEVPGIDETTFQAEAEKAKVGCPVSKALSAVAIHLNARLIQRAKI